MQELLSQARSHTDDWRYAHVGELMFAFLLVACHLDPRQHIRLWHRDDGRLVGYAILGEAPSIDWQVLPEQEWAGIETEVMAWAEARLAELRRRDAARWGGGLVSGARQDNGRRRVFLGQHGFRYSGDGSDIPRRAAAHRAVWQPWTDGDISDDDYVRFMQLPGYPRDLDLVTLAPDGAFAATVIGWVDRVNRVGCFGQVGALPAYRRRGYMRAALLEGLRRMRACGMDRACVSTGVSNIPAIRLYESVGFEIVNQYLDYVKPAVVVD